MAAVSGIGVEVGQGSAWRRRRSISGGLALPKVEPELSVLCKGVAVGRRNHNVAVTCVGESKSLRRRAEIRPLLDPFVDRD